MPAESRAVRSRSSSCWSSGATPAIASASSPSAGSAHRTAAEEFSEAADFVQQVDRDGSDLGGAIGLAASLIPRGRPGRLVVLSDGEANGASVTAAAHEAAGRGLPVDFRLFSRGGAADIAVESLDAPGMVDEREPFQFTASVRTDRTVESEGRAVSRWRRGRENDENISAWLDTVGVSRPD
jgi:hypothetical protein